MDIKELAQAVNEATTAVTAIKEKHDAELKANGDALAETKSALKAAEEKAAAKTDELKSLFEKMDAKFADMEAASKRFNGVATAVKSAGQAFVESDVYADMAGKGRANGMPFEVKDITGTAASALALARPDRDPEVYRKIGGQRQIRIADLLNRVPTSSGSVEVMRLSSFTNNAAAQDATVSSTAVGGGELGTKAKSELTWELVTVPVRTIAHYTIASRQVLSDAPMLSSVINNELTYGLQLQSDAQLLLGDGTGQNLTGLMTDTNIQTVGQLPFGTTDIPAAMIEHIRGAITKCQQYEYYNINGLVLNPLDWQKLETARATDGHYLLVAFAATSPETPSIWRVPVVVSNAMPANSFLLGDWSQGAQLYVREGVTIRVSESHANLFIQNGVAVLAEERYALGISRPKAFCKGLFTVDPVDPDA